jgi:2-amino-4-hydroxy-6-hydroxymethyldihydropteridine diphosphokinase
MGSGDGAKTDEDRWDDAVVVALGSNLGGDQGFSLAVLEAALARFGESGLKVLKRSSWWRSASWPDPTRPDYLNGVALVEASDPPEELLRALHALEASFGRDRHDRNAPRTLDLDLIACGRRVVDTGGLQLPHPRAAERLFVMGPLAEIAPAWRHPVTGATAAELAKTATVGRDARPSRHPGAKAARP